MSRLVLCWIFGTIVGTVASPDLLSAAEPQADLPRVLLIGDSISIGYTRKLR